MSSLLTLPRERERIEVIEFTGITSDRMLTYIDKKGLTQSLIPIYDVDWERILIDLDVTTLTGTSVTFKAKTCNRRQGGTAIAAGTMDAKNGAGTAIDSGSLTAAGRSMIAVARLDTDSGPSNIGGFIGLYADVTAITVLVGTATIYAGK